jgi:hypothetical protein
MISTLLSSHTADEGATTDRWGVSRTSWHALRHTHIGVSAVSSALGSVVPASVVVVICEPWGLNNLITMGIKTTNNLVGKEMVKC